MKLYILKNIKKSANPILILIIIATSLINSEDMYRKISRISKVRYPPQRKETMIGK